MRKQPKPIRIPLLGISGKVQLGEQVGGLPSGLKPVSEVEISLPQSVSNQGYALDMPNIAGESVGAGRSLGIFGPEKDISAMKDIYALGLKGQEPLVCKVIKNDAQPGSFNQGGSPQAKSTSRSKHRRKSFMTPTPLHIPESQVSPIPDSTHEMIYLKSLGKNEAVKVVPLQDVVWMHPLITVVETPSE